MTWPEMVQPAVFSLLPQGIAHLYCRHWRKKKKSVEAEISRSLKL